MLRVGIWKEKQLKNSRQSNFSVKSLYENVDAGVPVLGFLLFDDQQRNIDNLVNAGMAISMDLFSMTKNSFLKNVLEQYKVNNFQIRYKYLNLDTDLISNR